MTPQEYRKSIKELLPKIGLKAEAYTSFANEGPLYYVSLYPHGMVGSSFRDDAYLRAEADTFGELLEKLSNAWNEYEGRHRASTIRKMALAIIRITAELGECTDAALRNCGEFDAGQIAAYGEAACQDANEIAGKGPFKITVNGGSNNYEPDLEAVNG